MPKHEQPIPNQSLTTTGDKRAKPRWQDMPHGPKAGQRAAKHSRTLRVPGKGSGR